MVKSFCNLIKRNSREICLPPGGGRKASEGKGEAEDWALRPRDTELAGTQADPGQERLNPLGNLSSASCVSVLDHSFYRLQQGAPSPFAHLRRAHLGGRADLTVAADGRQRESAELRCQSQASVAGRGTFSFLNMGKGYSRWKRKFRGARGSS